MRALGAYFGGGQTATRDAADPERPAGDRGTQPDDVVDHLLRREGVVQLASDRLAQGLVLVGPGCRLNPDTASAHPTGW